MITDKHLKEIRKAARSHVELVNKERPIRRQKDERTGLIHKPLIDLYAGLPFKLLTINKTILTGDVC